jgi:hypothetical protein
MQQYNDDGFFTEMYHTFMKKLAKKIGERAAEELAEILLKHWPDIMKAAKRFASGAKESWGSENPGKKHYRYREYWYDIMQSAIDAMATHGAGWPGEACRECESRRTIYVAEPNLRFPWVLCSKGHFRQTTRAA